MDYTLEDPNNRFHGPTIDEVNAKLTVEGWATGKRVLAQVRKAYVEYVGGDSQLADAQLVSLFDALRHADEQS